MALPLHIIALVLLAAVLIGWIMLGEPFGARRAVASVLVAAGIAIMNLAG